MWDGGAAAVLTAVVEKEQDKELGYTRHKYWWKTQLEEGFDVMTAVMM